MFDIKLGENFWRKARYRADGHKTGKRAVSYAQQFKVHTTSKGANMKSGIRYKKKLFYMMFFSSFLDVKSRYKLRT